MAQVEKLRGSLKVEYTVADVTAKKLWKLLKEDAFVPALGAVTGNQAIQMVRGGLKSIYCSGWQVRPACSTPGASVLTCAPCQCCALLVAVGKELDL